jgi:membrane protein
MNRKEVFQLFKASFKNWQVNNAPIRGAALTFFIILPLPSLLLIVVAIFALIYGQTQATQHLIQQITALAGPSVAGLFKQLLASSMSPFASLWVAITAVGFSLGGAIGAFAVWRDTMDAIWEVKAPKIQSFTRMVRRRIGPFIIVSILGLIVIAWTGIATFLFGAIRFFSINETVTLISIAIARILLLFALSTLLFAIVYKLIPDAKVHWRDSILGAVVAGVAFTVTNYVIGTYVETFTVTTIIGAAGSLMIILLWIFILNQIMLYGAEVSKIYATTSPTHSREHLPPTAEKIVKQLEIAGKTIEQATKGNVLEPKEKPVEKPQTEEATEKTEIQTPKKKRKLKKKPLKPNS